MGTAKLRGVCMALAALGIALPAKAETGTATTTGFGSAGQFMVSLPRLVPIVGFTARKADTSASIDTLHGDMLTAGSDPNATNAHNVPRLGVDFTAARRLSFGFDVVTYVTLGTHPALGDAPWVSLFGIAPRVGYVCPLDRAVSLWLRGGVAYYAETDKGVNAGAPVVSYTSTWKALDAALEAHLVFSPTPHLAATVGVTVEVPLAGRFDEARSGGIAGVGASAAWWHLGLGGGILTYL